MRFLFYTVDIPVINFYRKSLRCSDPEGHHWWSLVKMGLCYSCGLCHVRSEIVHLTALPIQSFPTSDLTAHICTIWPYGKHQPIMGLPCHWEASPSIGGASERKTKTTNSFTTICTVALRFLVGCNHAVGIVWPLLKGTTAPPHQPLWQNKAFLPDEL